MDSTNPGSHDRRLRRRFRPLHRVRPGLALALAAALLLIAAPLSGCVRAGGAVMVSAGLAKYALVLSISPGLPLEAHVAGLAEGTAMRTTWTCEQGSFLTWGVDDKVVKDRGRRFELEGPKILWTPMPGVEPSPGATQAQGTTTVTVEVREAATGTLLGAATVHIDVDPDGFWYNLRENAAAS